MEQFFLIARLDCWPMLTREPIGAIITQRPVALGLLR